MMHIGGTGGCECWRWGFACHQGSPLSMRKILLPAHRAPQLHSGASRCTTEAALVDTPAALSI